MECSLRARQGRISQGWLMARKATHFETTMFHFVRQKAYPYEEPARSYRGYWTDGRSIIRLGYIIAVWREGAVRLSLTPEWHTSMISEAISKVCEWCEQEGVLARRSQRICKEHEDCKLHAKLGRACAKRFYRKTA